MTIYYNEHSKFFVSVDCIVFGFESNKLKLLIGKRQMDPGRNEWSLYGGFVGENETLDEAVQEMVKQGYWIEDPGVLDRISVTTAWAEGLAWLDRVFRASVPRAAA